MCRTHEAIVKNEPKKDYQVTPVRLPPDVKRRVRILAAEKGTSMSDMAEELLALGLAAYEESTNGKSRKTA